MKKVNFILSLIIFIAAICAPRLTYANDTTKVLFIGNSYTYVNDLPSMFMNLALSGGKYVVTGMSAPGGYMLENHRADSVSINLIRRGTWNYVVLQEQSQTPVINYYRYNSMYPSGRYLDSLIKSYNQQTMFFMTWGRQNGGQQCIDSFCSPVFTSFFHMQDSLKSAYTELSRMLNAFLSPVGEAWRTAKTQQPNIDLWQSDDSHPSLKGSYLAACVFFMKIFNTSPVGLSYTAGLSQQDALFLQNCAFQTVSGINENTAIVPDEITLLQNYPNPFNTETVITFSLNKSAKVNLRIFDITGKEILKIDYGMLKRGQYTGRIDASLLSSGIYFYNIKSTFSNLTRKMILLK
ncbi:MAG: T9SS type A sorting domain-containing protein [Ignavibacteria bacterium]|nr:T9SS type A sorting domain-containing protein [Ignavibacteria bacterium]